MGETIKEEAGAPNEMPFVAPCRQLAPSAPLGWLRQGWGDVRAAPLQSAAYGLFCAGISLLASYVAFRWGSYWLLYAALSGFVFVAPILCLGLYAISAQIERGERPEQLVSLREAGVRRLGTEMVFALFLLVVFLIWARAGSMVHVFFPMEVNPKLSDLATYLGIGSAVGAIFAAITFAASAFSLPMLMHRDVDSVTAIVTSINAVLRNKRAMIIWLSIIVAGLLLGVVTAFVGLVVIIPVIGYAAWHGYLETIDADEFPRHEIGITSVPRDPDL